MASAPDLVGRDDTTLWATGRLLDDIQARSSDWDARSEDERADLALEWEGLIARLEGLAADDRRGSLQARQRRDLQMLERRLDAARPMLTRLGLDVPNLGEQSRAS